MNEMKEMKLRNAIDERVKDLIHVAEGLVKDLGDKIGKIDASQIRNVMAVANSAPHPAVVTNFIRYQMGRRGKPKEAWDETGLGNRVIHEIEETVSRLAKGAAKDAAVEDVDDVQIRMTRLLLGFMNRRYVYDSDQYDEAMRAKRKKGGNDV